MSYRDLRNFTEMMRALGYHRLISMENFRRPNFPLVAEILLWLVKRYEPNAAIHPDTDTQQDRVLFIRSVTEFMATKAHIRLNSKKLYQADGYAVKELLKVISVLYNVMKTSNIGSLDEMMDSDQSNSLTFDISSKIIDMKEARKLASEITTKGATLYDLLSKEADLRESRSMVIGRQLEIVEVEKGIESSVKIVKQEIQKTLSMLENISSDEGTLDSKIEKRKTELERNRKRLQTLQNVRPAFMDEYEKLEQELKKIYENYIIKFRNLTYLEQQLEEYNKLEEDKFKENQFAMQSSVEKMREEEKRNLQSSLEEDEEFSNSDASDSGSEMKDKTQLRPQLRPTNNRIRPEAAKFTNHERKLQVQGSMFGAESDDENGLDSDIALDDDDDDDDDDEIDDDDLDDDDLRMPARPNMAQLKTNARHQQAEIDDEDTDDAF